MLRLCQPRSSTRRGVPVDTEATLALAQDLPVEVTADSTLRAAMQLLAANDVESALVRDEGEVIGVFTMRRLADLMSGQRFPKSADPVDGWIMAPEFYRADEPMDSLIKRLTRSGVLLVGDPSNVSGVITLRAVAEFAQPFLMIAEIERALREALGALIPPDERGPLFATVLASTSGGRPLPNALDRLTIGDYRSILTHRMMLDRSRPVFGGSVGPRLEKIGELRNSLFHFRDPLTLADLQFLEGERSFFRVRLDRMRRRAQPAAGSSEVT